MKKDFLKFAADRDYLETLLKYSLSIIFLLSLIILGSKIPFFADLESSIGTLLYVKIILGLITLYPIYKVFTIITEESKRRHIQDKEIWYRDHFSQAEKLIIKKNGRAAYIFAKIGKKELAVMPIYDGTKDFLKKNYPYLKIETKIFDYKLK